jgi:endonuclease YncB( thermonuclease family)
MMVAPDCLALDSTGRTRCRRGAGALLLSLLLSLLPLALTVAGVGAAASATTCAFAVVATATVQRVVDGRTFVLADGREVRLAGIETPFAGAVGEAEAGLAAAAALRRVIGENEIVLKQLNPVSDRYGRLLAHAFVRGAAGETPLSRELLAQGHGLLSARPGEAACLRDLIRDLAAAERSARLAKLGLWGDPRYDLKRAENPAEVLAVRGRFTLVEGKVLSVRESGSTIYVNFGRRWTEDFTVTILKRNERLFVAAGLAPQRLQGRRVQVRGVVEERGGPWIEATRPEQIEVVDGH